MDTKAFLNAYNESRNGADNFTRHGLVRFFVYSNGVQECAKAGCYWLLDIVGTEIAPKLARGGFDRETNGWVVVTVKDSKAKISFEVVEGKPLYTRKVEYTDLPNGRYEFEIGYDGTNVMFSLISEH